MSIESGIRDKVGEIQYSIGRSAANFSTEIIPYVLPALDAFIILLSCLAGGISYHLLIGDPFEILPLCAVRSLASLIYILRMNGSGYYELQEIAKPRVEVREILVCWFTTGLLLALVAFLLKISATYSRGTFVIFYIVAPMALLVARKATKAALAQAVTRGAIGRRDTVLIGDFNEMAALKGGDLLALCGAPDVRRFTLSREDDELMRSSKDVQVINAATTFMRRHDCRQILIMLPWNDAGRIEYIRGQIKTLPIAIQLQRAPLSAAQHFVKRITDVVVASLGLIFFPPLMALAAIAIKLDSP